MTVGVSFIQGMLILFEHASGYAIFKVSGADEVSQMIQDAVPDFTQFCQLVSLSAFQPFKTAANALDNINNISEGNISVNVIIVCWDVNCGMY